MHNKLAYLFLIFFFLGFINAAGSVTGSVPPVAQQLNASHPLGIYINGQLIDSADNSSIVYPVPIGVNDIINVTYAANFSSTTSITYKYEVGATAPTTSMSIGKTLDHTVLITASLGKNITVTISDATDDPSIVIVPVPVDEVLPINLNNQQTAPVLANTPIMLGYYGTGVTANIIGFDAATYSAYESANLMNVEFFYANGTVMYSWLEGNYFNELAANGLATSSASRNALVDDANIIWWVEPSNSIFLSGSNTIYMGFAPIGDNLMTTPQGLVGEAPQLSCANGAGALSSCPTYGEYDNGNNIFSYELNFTGTTVPAWAKENVQGSSTITNANILTISTEAVADNNALFYAQIGSDNSNTVVETLQTTQTNTKANVGLGTITTQILRIALEDSYFGFFNSGTVTDLKRIGTSGTFTTIVTTANVQTTTPQILGLAWQATGTQYVTANYLIQATGTDTTYAEGTSYPFIAETSGGSAHTTTYQWLRTRIAPPNYVMPNTIYGNMEAVPTVSMGAPSNQFVDIGQYESVTATVVGGSTPFTYAFNAFNVMAVGTVTNTFSATGINSQSDTWTYYLGFLGANTEREANVFIQDSLGITANSVPSSPYVVNAMLQAGLLTETNTVIDAGQYSTLTSSYSGGTPTVTINWFTGSSCNTALGQTGSTLLVNPSSTTTYSFNAVDSATTNAVVCASNTITVYSTPTTLLTITPSNAVSPGTQTTMNDLVSGGSGSFTFSNTLNNANFQGTLVGSTGVSNVLNNPVAGNFVYNVIVTDIGTTTPYVIAQQTNTLVVSTSYVPPMVSISSPSNAIVDAGQWESFIATITSGTSPFSFTFNAVNSITTSTVVNGIYVSGQASPYTWTYFVGGAKSIANSPIIANVQITDAHPTTVNSIYSSHYIVNPSFSSIGLSVSLNPINPVQTQTITATVLGGSPGYVYTYDVYNPSSALIYSYTTANSYTSNSFSFVQGTPGGTWTATVSIYDSATTNEIVTNSLVYTVNAPSAPSQYLCIFNGTLNNQIGTGIYQNNAINGNTLVLHVTTTEDAEAYLSSNSNIPSWAMWTLLTPNGNYNLSDNLYVPPGWYFQVTGDKLSFTEECFTVAAIGNSNTDPYFWAGIALILLSIGWLIIFGYVNDTMFNGLSLKQIAWLVTILLLLVAAFEIMS